MPNLFLSGFNIPSLIPDYFFLGSIASSKLYGLCMKSELLAKVSQYFCHGWWFSGTCDSFMFSHLEVLMIDDHLNGCFVAILFEFSVAEIT